MNVGQVFERVRVSGNVYNVSGMASNVCRVASGSLFSSWFVHIRPIYDNPIEMRMHGNFSVIRVTPTNDANLLFVDDFSRRLRTVGDCSRLWRG